MDFQKQTLEQIVSTLEKELIEAEKKDVNVLQIRKAINNAILSYNKFNMQKSKLELYNNAVERITKMQSFFENQNIKNSLKYPFQTEASENAYYEELISQSIYKEYHKKQLAADMALINSFNNEFLPVVIEGYKSILALRKLLTGQEIIYAVQGIDGSRIYQEYLREEDFIQLLSIKAQYNNQAYLKQFNAENFSGGSSLVIDFDKIAKKFNYEFQSKLKSRDLLYRAISNYVQDSNGKKLSSSSAWEFYTEARRIFTNTSDENLGRSAQFKSFMGKRLAAFQGKGVTFKSYNGSEKGLRRNISTLNFYKGGDTQTFSKYVLIQNKSSVKGMEAGINISTVYNGLKYINEIFVADNNINVKKVKELFLATSLKGMGNNIATESFKIANKKARESIEKVIKILNNT